MEIDIDVIIQKSVKVKKFIEENKRLPNFVRINKQKIQTHNFFLLVIKTVLNLENNNINPLALKTYYGPERLTIQFSRGRLNKHNYISLAEDIKRLTESQNQVIDYMVSHIGTLSYENLVYIFSKILEFHLRRHRLPNFVIIQPFRETEPYIVPQSLQRYIRASQNCEVDHPEIRRKMESITKGKVSKRAKAVAIFYWVRNNIRYTMSYRNTRKGALGTLNVRIGNCVDHTHLLIALIRAAGIPARYMHGRCTFLPSGMVEGHVWANIWVDRRWNAADTTSRRNTFDVIRSWDTRTVKMIGTHISLPF